MKTAVLAIAVLMSGAAFAQTATTTDTATQDSAYGTTSQSTMDHSTTIQTTASLSPASAPVVQPSNANPERDARGIAVLSDAALVPDGWNGVSGTAMGGPLVDPATGETLASDDSYPACSASVTDNCLQAYERGRSAS
jgi:hypothetical protein